MYKPMMEDKMAKVKKKAKLKNEYDITIYGIKPGAELEIEVDANGVPTDRFLRRRMEEAKSEDLVKVKNRQGWNKFKLTEIKKKEVTE